MGTLDGTPWNEDYYIKHWIYVALLCHGVSGRISEYPLRQSGGLGVGGSNPLAPTNKIKGLQS
jgi:hypothetical protein